MTGNCRSTLLHLRFPFSLFLLPIFLGAVAAERFDSARIIPVLVIFHLLLYPASNGFNSYFDKDEGPIGGIAVPPPVSPSLLLASLLLDAVALVWSFLISPVSGIAAIVYGTGSKLYSWDKVRIKRMPFVGWIWTGLGQGTITFLAMSAMLSGRNPVALDRAAYAGSLLVTTFLLGVYPLTQVYQHDEDARRGDMTISRRLGIRGTFMLAGVFFGAAALGFFLWIASIGTMIWSCIFLGMQVPSMAYFLVWAARVFRDPGQANHRNTMRMNSIASSAMSLFFILFITLR